MLDEGNEVYLLPNNDPKRKLKFGLEIINSRKNLVGVNTHLANRIVQHGLENNLINELKNNDIINKMGFNYIISENVMTGTIIWESNNEDSLLINILSEDELNEGSVFIDEFNDKINLVDGVSYNISMFVVDSANNLSDTLFLNNITYDDSQPTISLINPISNSNVKSSNISYELSETMSNIEIVWERVSGSRDAISEHSISLVDDELIMGSFEDKVLINKPQLQEGAIYNLKIFGFDLAGNMSNDIFVEN